MHEVRSIVGGEKRSVLAAKKSLGSDRPKRGLASIAIPREESRKTNQRREDRHLNLADQAAIIFRRKRIEVTVSNVSPHGVMIEADIDARVGENIQISFAGCNRTQCTVRWIKGGRIGMEFAQETVLIAPREVRELIVAGRRSGEQVRLEMKKERAPRQRLYWKGMLHHGAASTEARLHNISASGAMLDCGIDLSVGMPVVLELTGGAGDAIPGRVRWCRSGQVGLSFDHSFDMRVLARVQAGNVDALVPRYLKPDYLASEGSAHSPWASRTEGLRHEDL